jgi:hypothetical protein
MPAILAYADSNDPNSMNLVLILGGAGILAVTAILSFALIYLSRARDHRQADLITGIALFWGLIAAGSSLYAMVSQVNWSKEYTLQLESGYLDPTDTSDKPQLPWAIWGGLVIAYGTILLWSLSQKRGEPPPPEG